jgi:hypothetical protein
MEGFMQSILDLEIRKEVDRNTSLRVNLTEEVAFKVYVQPVAKSNCIEVFLREASR